MAMLELSLGVPVCYVGYLMQTLGIVMVNLLPQKEPSWGSVFNYHFFHDHRGM